MNVFDDSNWGLKHFKPDELRCRGTGQLIIDQTAGLTLEKLRVAFGDPLIVVSGYRSPSYNARVGGSKDSFHMQGRAFDLFWPSFEVDQHKLLGLALKFFGGIGLYRTFLHVDTGPKRVWVS